MSMLSLCSRQKHGRVELILDSEANKQKKQMYQGVTVAVPEARMCYTVFTRAAYGGSES